MPNPPSFASAGRRDPAIQISMTSDHRTSTAAGINIAQMHNASRGDYAYNLIDTDEDVAAQVVDNLQAIDGVLSVRVI